MSFRYNTFQKVYKILKRKLYPMPKSPWTAGKVDDICAIELVPSTILESFFETCLDVLKESRNGEWDYLEFGVFNGSSLGSMYLAAKRKKQKIRFYGFDAFQGLPPGSEKEDDGVWKTGFYSCSFTDMKQCLKRRGVDEKKITWVKGWYDKTLTSALAKKVNPGIVFIDCDTYSSSKIVLDWLAPLIKKPTIICLDDWKLNDLDVKELGEYKAFNEFLEENPQLIAKEIQSYNRKSKTFIVQSEVTL